MLSSFLLLLVAEVKGTNVIHFTEERVKRIVDRLPAPPPSSATPPPPLLGHERDRARGIRMRMPLDDRCLCSRMALREGAAACGGCHRYIVASGHI